MVVEKRVCIFNITSLIYYTVPDRLQKDRRVINRVKTNDNEWQRMTASGTTSDNEWYYEKQRVTANDNKLQRVTTSSHFD